MTSHRVQPAPAPAAALAEAADLAGYAPSIHNTQPWRWRVDRGQLELYADTGRQLAASDPNGRLMMVSCGAALHHARTALAARGWRIEVDRMPDPDRSDLLARLTPTGSDQDPTTARQRSSRAWPPWTRAWSRSDLSPTPASRPPATRHRPHC